MRRALPFALLMLAGCDATQPTPAANAQREDKPTFPKADRPVATIVSARWSTEESRDRLNEAELVMDKAGIAPGMTVADIGAGEGYYTIRLAQRVGDDGRVLAEDIIPQIRDALAQRVARERLDNVSVRLGEPDDAKLPINSFDRVLMVHMYHEIAEPYAFLWNLRPSIRKGGRVVVVDADRPTQNHGTPPALLKCEFEAVGYKLVELQKMPSAGGYIAMFTPDGRRPEPKAIVPCRVPMPASRARLKG
ncbi:class I SAM-dependent methyltransferase [Sphingomonas panni]|uniref:class I SAM-dependent methyltransferase n=1 Tax=Sphingomonas panni TaxID=237612 RepID=UPI001F5B648B|nr:methyltransferase domain-containing protein [Sphingomonas panni]